MVFGGSCAEVILSLLEFVNVEPLPLVRRAFKTGLLLLVVGTMRAELPMSTLDCMTADLPLLLHSLSCLGLVVSGFSYCSLGSLILLQSVNRFDLLPFLSSTSRAESMLLAPDRAQTEAVPFSRSFMYCGLAVLVLGLLESWPFVVGEVTFYKQDHSCPCGTTGLLALQFLCR